MKGPRKTATRALKSRATSTPAVKMAAPTHPVVSFEFVKPGASRVCVAGSFNDWNPEKAPLIPTGDGRWIAQLEVDPGRYEYLFVADGQWVADPKAPESVENPFGGRNSVVTVAS